MTMALVVGGVTTLFRGFALAEGLASGLQVLGWQPLISDRTARPIAGQPVVVVEDDAGVLPEVAVSLAARIARAGGRVVAVAGRAALPIITRVVRAGATAINADLPFRSVLMTLHNVLRAGPVTATQRAAHAAHLGRRAEEMSRFGYLTGRECAVLAAVVTGRSAEEIARSRPVGLSTIRTQIASVLRKHPGVRRHGDHGGREPARPGTPVLDQRSRPYRGATLRESGPSGGVTQRGGVDTRTGRSLTGMGAGGRPCG